jgi:hypothetical protein
VRDVLTAAGFRQVEQVGLRAPIWFGSNTDDAHGFVLGLLGWMLDGVAGAIRDRALDNLQTALRAHDTGSGVFFESAT